MAPFPQTFTSTVSHWQATNRGPTALWDHGKQLPLPEDLVDYVIIGAGITGASLAYQLSRSETGAHGKSIVVLEAKDVASGAKQAGRNGGHIAPASWQSFSTLVAPLQAGGAGLSEDEALDVIFNEADTLALAEEIITLEKLDVDFWKGSKLEVKTTEKGVEANLSARDAFMVAKASSVKYAEREFQWDAITIPDQVAQISRVRNARMVNMGPAGSCHPHRLTTSLLRLALESTTSTCRLFTWAPVMSLNHTQDLWKVDCGVRGVMNARNVILCTNGWTRHLFDEDLKNDTGLAAHVTPFRGHAALIVPPSSHSGSRALTSTYGLEGGPYLMSTPHAGIVMGVYNATALEAGIANKADIFDVEDDSVVLPRFQDWLSDYCRTAFEGWSNEIPGEGLSRVWSGIMGASRDLLPLIGPVPDKSGLWASVAFQGHGMARILSCTRSLASQILNEGKWDERLPRCFEITNERLERAKRLAPPPLSDEERRKGPIDRIH